MDGSVIKILLTGDFCPINRIENLALDKDFDKIFNDFKDVFKGNDLNIVDLECPLTGSTLPRKKIGPHQKAHPGCINILKSVNVGLVALANNHIMDYGQTGVTDTLVSCGINNISTVGIGNTYKEAASPHSATFKGKKISILNFADDEFITTPDKSYLCNILDPVRAFFDIAEIKGKSDYLLAIIHAGNEFYSLPSPRTKRLYRYIIDCGADVVIAHHTHAFSGYEIYKSKPIFFGLGNFIYDWPGKINTTWNYGYVVKILLSDRIDFELIPLKQNNLLPGVFHLTAEETAKFRSEINRLNSIINDDCMLKNEFVKYCENVLPMYNSYIEPYLGKYVASLRNRGLFPKFMTRRKRMLLLNLFRCESHREVLIQLLSKYEK